MTGVQTCALPISENLRENFYKYLAKTNSNPLGIEIKSAKGNYLYNNKNKKYLDFIAGVSVCNLGHGHPKVINAIEKQLKKHLHVMVYGEFIQETPTLLAKELINILPKNQEVLYLTNSGPTTLLTGLRDCQPFDSNFFSRPIEYENLILF